MDAKRGYVPEDDSNFAPGAIGKMRTASRHILYLINEGYDLKQASTFVGNHYLLSERQRLALMRSVATREQLAARAGREVPLKELAGQEIWVDGFNTIITLEVLLSDSILLECMDGTVRDLASLRGTYRIIPETRTAVKLLLDVLEKVKIGIVHILLDEPVSNSGRLKALIADIGEAQPFCTGIGDGNPHCIDAGELQPLSTDTKEARPLCLDIQIQRDVDRALYIKENVVTSDSIILDHCSSWVNLMKHCMQIQGKAGIRVWEEGA